MQRSHVSAQRVALGLVTLVVLYFGVGALLHYSIFPEAEPPAGAYAKSGFAFESPTGEKFTVMRSSVETGGEFAQVQLDFVPGGHVAREHVHPHQEESFRVLEGSLVALVNGEEKVVSVGETLVVPPGTPHQLFNRSDGVVRTVGEIRPAGKAGLFFGQMAGLDFKPSFLQMMLFLQAYEMYPASPPPALLRPLSFLLAPTARLVGYKSFYPEYAERFQRSAAQQGAVANQGQRAPIPGEGP